MNLLVAELPNILSYTQGNFPDEGPSRRPPAC